PLDPALAAAPVETALAGEAPVMGTEPLKAQVSARPPWEQPEAEEPEDNGRAGAADWQPWETNAVPARPAPSARPPWEDATPDGGNGGARRAEDPAIYVPAGPAGTLTAAFA